MNELNFTETIKHIVKRLLAWKPFWLCYDYNLVKSIFWFLSEKNLV